MDSVHTRETNLEGLHPEYIRIFQRLEQALVRGHETSETETLFKVFEAYRSFERQDYLYASKTTKARGGQSAHNYGLAVDFVPFVNGRWSWELNHDWEYLRIQALNCGLCNQTFGLRWDKPHVQVCDWRKVLDRTG